MKLLAGGLLWCILTVGAAAAATLVNKAPPRAATLTNPLAATKDAGRAGAKLYRRECAACHGLNREGGGKVPPLDQAEVHNAPPGVLFWILRNGSSRRRMPSFAHLPEPQLWQIITFLKSQPRPE